MASPTTHAKLSASGAHLWLAAPGAVWMEEGIPDHGSPFAAEGTLAHAVTELKLQLATEQISKSWYTRRLNACKKSEYWSKSMDEYTDDHVSLVLEDLAGHPDATLTVEQRVDFSKWVPNGFGTSDTIIAETGHISIWDLKYGKGVPVDAEWNPQIMLYALGAYELLDDVYDIKTVDMTIDQPRLGNVSTFSMTVADLVKWAEDVVKPAAEAAEMGKAQFDFSDPNSWRFYKAAGFDKHLAQENLKILKYKFKEANSLTGDEIADIVEKAPAIKRWLQAVEDYATAKVYDGELDVPGYKVVAGRSLRKITDSQKAEELMQAAGYTPEQYQRHDLLTITQLEKLIGKKDFNDVLGNVVDKPLGKPTLVPEKDKREPLNKLAQAQDDFD